ncbi:MAG: putative cytokinetic ring protein SteA [Nocardioides sp.]|nr:putative cytokinetic ring protein SteA [Nocardioides sp.]
MKFPTRKPPPVELPGTTGTARVDRRTSAALARAGAGDVLVVEHQDMDRTTAQDIVDRGVTAVVNVRPFISGRYPNLGPALLAAAGVVLVDQVDAAVLRSLRDGTEVRLHDGVLHVGDAAVATGRVVTSEIVAAEMTEARAGLTSQLESFTHNATEFLRREQDLLLHGLGAPELRTSMTGRPVVVVVRGYDYATDLRRLRRFIAEQRPVLVGVDAGVDAIREAGLRVDVAVVGEAGLSDATDEGLRSAREVVRHTDRTGRVRGAGRLEALAIRARDFGSAATTEDLALLLADIGEASAVVCVGTHASLDEFLDRQRAGLASTFLTRLRVGPRLVDARVVPDLHAGRVRRWHLALVLLVGLVALGVAVAATPVGNDWWTDFAAWSSTVLERTTDRVRGAFS